MKIRILILLLLLVASCGEKKQTEEGSQKRTKNEVVEVVYEEVPDMVEATGYVEPDKEGIVKINSPLAGVVQSIQVQVGDAVKRGQLLAVIKAPDTTDLYSQKASLSIQLAQAERLYKLKKELYEIGAIPKTEFMDAETNYKVIKAQLEGMEKKLRLLGGGLGTLSLTSPVDGVVYQVNAHVGDQIDPSKDILGIANPKKVLVVALIPDKDAIKVKKGNKAEFSISLYPDRKFSGAIKYVSDVADPETHTVKVFIEPAEKEAFKINMFFNIKLLTGQKTYAVLPKRTLVFQDGKFYVYVLENGKPVKKEGAFIKELDEEKVALSGIEKGQKVLLTPMREVSP